MPSPVILILLGIVGWGLWQALQPRCLFVIKLVRGEPRVIRGTVTRAFLGQIKELCEHHGVSRGTVRCQFRAAGVGLDLRGPFPPECRQQMRNIWVNSGWSGGPSQRRRAR
ncbi:MAG: DUF3634 family protein [Isosphaeraceae bacterium]